jgi:hypothetical protein
MGKSSPTDLRILREIYNRYYDEFVAYRVGARASKVYVPVDCEAIGKALGVDGDIIFGRLYYYLDERYRYHQDDGAAVHLFTKEIDGDTNCINFPLLGAVVAKLKTEQRRYWTATAIAIGALIVAIISLVVSASAATVF